MTTWTVRLDRPPGAAPTVAVKDAIDVVGLPTSAGCRAVAEQATPASRDAACLGGCRSTGAFIAGKTNLHELCFGTTGINSWLGTPVNPRAPDRIPGGSSSGSAVAVAAEEADIGLGTDTGGSVRIPAACCGIVGLKTTWGRVSLEGVWPLAARLDTVGPLARTVGRVAEGMALLAPGFAVAGAPASIIGRLRIPDVDPEIDAAVDRALAASGLEVVPIELPRWDTTRGPFRDILLAGAWDADRHLLGRPGLSADIAEGIEAGGRVTPAALAAAEAARDVWRQELAAAFSRVEVIALPTLDCFPPRLDDVSAARLNRLTAPWNLSGSPSLALPVPAQGPVPASLQLVGPDMSEDLLCATGAIIEAAVAR